MFIGQTFSDEDAKDFLINFSKELDSPFEVMKNTKVERFCEGGQSLPLNINNEYVVRIPRSQGCLDEMKKESAITKICAKHIHHTNISNVSIFEYKGLGFAVHKSINGKTMDINERPNNVHYHQLSDKQKDVLAKDLGRFFSEMHQIPIKEMAQFSGNGVDYFQKSNFWGNKNTLLKQGINLSNYIPDDKDDLVCCHNDLHGRNIAIDESKTHVLQGVFDFGMCGINRRSADFVKLYTIDRELARKTMEAYNKISPQQVSIKNADGQFLAWCATNIKMAESLPEEDRKKMMESINIYLDNFKNDRDKELNSKTSKFEKRNKLMELRGLSMREISAPINKTSIDRVYANMQQGR